jgi:NAD(P)-dependent dehydrogenase (short-subunit alcohol dehydrogenase family)
MTRISFEDRAVIVTGAGGGLGRGYALELARRGAQVLVNDLGGALDGSGGSSKPADRVVEEIQAIGGIAAASYDSVASPAGGRRIVENCLDAFGRLDAVINNAGNLRYAPFDELGDEDVEAVVGTHLLGAFHVSRPAFRAMKQDGGGRFVFTSSGAGLFGNARQAHYSAAKAGLLGLMNAVAIEGEPYGIRANCVLPVAHTRMAEGTDTSQIRPRDAARMAGFEKLGDTLAADFVTPFVVFLASDECAVTQQAFSAAWGRYARVFVAATPGWYGPRDAPAAPEDVRDHLPEIEDRSRYFVPSSVFDEAGYVIENLLAGRENPPAGRGR